MIKKVGRNSLCPCGSGKKFKHCCLQAMEASIRLGEHEKRVLRIGALAAPPPGTEAYEEAKDRFQREKKDEVLDAKIRNMFTTACVKLKGDLGTGASLICDKNLRYFQQEYNNRIFQHGLWSFPTSFNVVEAFFNYETPLNYLKVRTEKNYLFSFGDYMDFVTSDRCIDKLDDALSYFQEGNIYHFNNADDPKILTVKNNLAKEFGFAGISIIKHSDEVNIILTLGELTDTEKMDKEILENFKFEPSKDPVKSQIKPSEDLKLEAGRLGGIEGLWQNIVLMRFDLSQRTHQVRYLLQDCGNNFTVYTDDLDAFSGLNSVDQEKYFQSSLLKFRENLVLFEIGKMSLFLPYFFEMKCDDVVLERHPTNLKSMLTPDEIKQYVSVENRLFYRDVLVLKSESACSPDIRTVKAPELKIEKSGYWKQLTPGQIGTDKKGSVIHGKTWVVKQLTWLESDNEEVLTVYKNQTKHFNDPEKSGFIYVMRSAAHARDIFKVGLTKRSIEVRADELSRTTGSPDKFLVVDEWEVNDCLLAEKLIHEKLSRFRINPNREFFQAQYKDIRSEIESVLSELNRE